MAGEGFVCVSVCCSGFSVRRDDGYTIHVSASAVFVVINFKIIIIVQFGVYDIQSLW